MKLRRRRATPSWPCIRRKIQRVARSNILRPRRRRRSGLLRQPPPPRRSLAPRRRRRGRRRPSPSRGPKHQTRPLPSKRSERLLLPRTAPRGRARRIFRALCRRLNSTPLWRSKTRPCRNQTSVSEYSHFRENATLADRKRTSTKASGAASECLFASPLPARCLYPWRDRQIPSILNALSPKRWSQAQPMDLVRVPADRAGLGRTSAHGGAFFGRAMRRQIQRPRERNQHSLASYTWRKPCITVEWAAFDGGRDLRLVRAQPVAQLAERE